MDWWYGDYDYEQWGSEKKEEQKEGDLPWSQVACTHDWKATVLIISTVYDCTKCKLKKEDYKKWLKKK